LAKRTIANIRSLIAPSLRGGTTKQTAAYALIMQKGTTKQPPDLVQIQHKKTPPNRMVFSIVQKQKLEIRIN